MSNRSGCVPLAVGGALDALGIFFGVMAGGRPALAVELITNGNFQTGDLAGWTNSGSTFLNCDTDYKVNNTGDTGCFSVAGNATFAAYNSFDGAGPKIHAISQTI